MLFIILIKLFLSQLFNIILFLYLVSNADRNRYAGGIYEVRKTITSGLRAGCIDKETPDFMNFPFMYTLHCEEITSRYSDIDNPPWKRPPWIV